jgi:hypothetical protein
MKKLSLPEYKTDKIIVIHMAFWPVIGTFVTDEENMFYQKDITCKQLLRFIGGIISLVTCGIMLC